MPILFEIFTTNPVPNRNVSFIRGLVLEIFYSMGDNIYLNDQAFQKKKNSSMLTFLDGWQPLYKM